MWLRTREIKPGVHETQSVGRYAAGQIGIVVGILFGAFLIVIGVVSLFTGNAGPVLFFAVPLAAIGFWHYRYYKNNPAQPRRPGPWD